MGNELSVTTDSAQSPAQKLRHFTPRSMRNQRGVEAPPNSLAAAARMNSGLRLDYDGGTDDESQHLPVKVGDRFELWHSGPVKEPAFRVGVVKKVFERTLEAATPDRSAHVARRPVAVKYVRLKFTDGKSDELMLRSLRVAVQQAMDAREKEHALHDKIHSLGLAPGTSAELWVPLKRDGSESFVAAPSASQPGDIRMFFVKDSIIQWNFEDVNVNFELLRYASDGPTGDAEVLPYNVVLTMLENAQRATGVLDERLAEVQEADGVTEGMNVHLWMEALGENVEGTVTTIGHHFQNLRNVSLKPTVTYQHGGKEREENFPDFDSFMVVWKKGEFVVEQSKKLWDEAQAHGVIAGNTICIYQPPRTRRWPGSKFGGGALDAEVMNLQFQFDAVQYELVMTAHVRYAILAEEEEEAWDKGEPIRAVKKYLSREAIPWTELQPRLRSKLVISNIGCARLQRQGTADPYVELVLDQTKHRTPHLVDAINPDWLGLEFEFREGENVNHLPTEEEAFLTKTMTLKVFNKNIGFDTFMGMTTVSLSGVIPTGSQRVTLQLGPKKPSKHQKDFGEITFTLRGCGPGIKTTDLEVPERRGITPTDRKKQEQDNGRGLFLNALSL